jgi:hypothetical protein
MLVLVKDGSRRNSGKRHSMGKLCRTAVEPWRMLRKLNVTAVARIAVANGFASTSASCALHVKQVTARWMLLHSPHRFCSPVLTKDTVSSRGTSILTWVSDRLDSG